MQFIRLLISLLVLASINTTSNAQINTAYNIGSIGFSGTTNPVFSGPVLITGEHCFVLTNGVKTFDLPQVGFFTNACRLLLQTDAGSLLTAYPNPVAKNVIVQSAMQPQLLNDGLIQLQLLDMQGRVIKSYQTNSRELNHGYNISMSQFVSGGYYIKAISGITNFQLLSIIKLN
jgi:hypothetical protein